MKAAEWFVRCAGAAAVCAGLCIPVISQTPSAARSDTQQAQSTPSQQIPPCSCVSRPIHPHPSPVLPKPTCDSCDCERQKTACTLAIAAEKAAGDAELGRYYLDTGQYEAAFTICQEALKLASTLPSARSCDAEALKILREERKKKLPARLAAVDARLSRGEVNEAFGEIERIRSELAPTQSPLGDFDEQMNAEIAIRLNRAKWLKWFTWIFAGLPILFWAILKVFAVFLAVLLVGKLLQYALDLFLRHQRYRTRKLESEGVSWTVWSIRDAQDQGAAGPVMDALNPKNNPLLNKSLKPSALLLVPLLPVGDDTGVGDVNESLVWRDFLDPPRDAIDMEILPLAAFEKHRFIQIEAFDELDIKVGGVEAKGVIGLFRTFRKWLDRGLPATQGTVYTLLSGEIDKRSYACVRITCNWTTELQALSSQNDSSSDGDHRPDGEHPPESEHRPGDETLSVFASSAHDPSIDAVALSAQRAAFKLFHRLATKSSPTYATAVANFHQGVALIDEYI